MKKRTVALLCSSLLLCGVAIGGTMAWLTAETAPVLNTFTVGDINIDLKEHDYDPANKTLDTSTEVENNDYHFVPGDTLPKDPFVTVEADSEACWLFIRVVEENNELTLETDEGTPILFDAITYGITTDWTPLAGHEGYYYLKVDAETAKEGEEWNILLNNEVTIDSRITKEMVDGEAGLELKPPKLKFTAAAIQSEHVETVEAAWENLPKGFK